MRSVIAIIREQDCIGCTKCIQACPVDAIIGSAKFMHTVIESECIGCELCIKPCPVDCIDLIEYDTYEGLEGINLAQYKLARSALSKERFRARSQRLAEEEKQQQEKYSQIKNKQEEIKAALLRAQKS
ncbi:MAG: RnfABCDGE type electron transport complex subunit B [Pseudomonadota bacterium]